MRNNLSSWNTCERTSYLSVNLTFVPLTQIGDLDVQELEKEYRVWWK